MFLPISDAPNPKGTPWATWTLIGLNVAVYVLVNVPLGLSRPAPTDPALQEYLRVLLPSLPAGVSLQALVQQTTAYDLFVFEHGFRPGAPELTDLITSMFLHGGFMHLFGNMLFLWIYGDNVEHRLGRVGFVLSYLGTGIAATLFFALFAAGSQVPLVGASGAISGVLGFYFLWFPRNVVRVWVFLFPIWMDVVEVSARIVLGLYLIVDNLLPFVFSAGAGAGGVAHGAHLGGFGAGVAAAFALDRFGARARPIGRPDRSRERRAEGGDAVRALLRQGDLEQAATHYLTLPPARARGALTPEESLRLARWLAERGYARQAQVVLQRLIRDHPAGPWLARAHLELGLVQLHGLRQPTSAYQHLLTALELAGDADTEARARVALAEIAALQKWAGVGRRRR